MTENGTSATPDTRARITQVALELFAEHGYDGTSLRQIAERLGITKAALYYHFKSKDEIVTGVLTEMFEGVDALLAWARGEPPTAATRREVLRRYANLAQGSLSAMRFVQHPAGGRETHPGAEFKNRIAGLTEVLVPPDPTVEQRGKAILAVVSLHVGSALASGHSPFHVGGDVDPTEGREAMLRIAMDLVGFETAADAAAADAAETAAETEAATAADATAAADADADAAADADADAADATAASAAAGLHSTDR